MTKIEVFAADVFTQIREIEQLGDLPHITEFSQLHDYFDANVGWGDQIDTLDPEAWAAVQEGVNSLLSGNYEG
jgi:hypothetical protein